MTTKMNARPGGVTRGGHPVEITERGEAYVTAAAAAVTYGMAPQTAYNLGKRREVRVCTHRGVQYLSVADLEAWKKRREEQNATRSAAIEPRFKLSVIEAADAPPRMGSPVGPTEVVVDMARGMMDDTVRFNEKREAEIAERNKDLLDSVTKVRTPAPAPAPLNPLDEAIGKITERMQALENRLTDVTTLLDRKQRGYDDAVASIAAEEEDAIAKVKEQSIKRMIEVGEQWSRDQQEVSAQKEKLEQEIAAMGADRYTLSAALRIMGGASEHE